MNMVARSIVVLGGVAAAAVAHADPSATGTLSFDQRLGTVASNVDIPVFLTLTLDPTSVPLTTGPDAMVTSGLTDQNITDAGLDPTVYTDRIVNEGFGCSGNFVAGCGSTTAGAYHFDFNFDAPAFVTPSNFDLEPGQSYSFLFGTFKPNGGNAPAGVYQFFNASIFFELFNSDQSMENGITIANTCLNDNPVCAFTRVVTPAIGAVPEPATWALMVGGFGLVGGAVRRRARTVVA